MFKTKSLTPIKLPLTKKHTHNSLRSLIADKTVRYHQQFQRLILDDNNLAYSGKKKQLRESDMNCHSPVSPGMIRIKEFKLPKQKENEQNKEPLQPKLNNFPSDFSPCMYLDKSASMTPHDQTIITPKLDSISQKTPDSVIPIEEVEMMEEMQAFIEKHHEELGKRQKKINDNVLLLEQYENKIKDLQTVNNNLVQINKELRQNGERLLEQNASLKDKIFMRSRQFKVYGDQFSLAMTLNSKIEDKINVVECGTNTEMICDDIALLFANKTVLEAKNSRLQKDFKLIQQFIQGEFTIDTEAIRSLENDHHKQIQENSNREKEIILKLEKYHKRNLDAHRNEVELFKQVNRQIKKNYQDKMSHLVKLLHDAECEIKVLLKKLRQASDNSVMEHKKSTQQSRLCRSIPKKIREELSEKQNILPF